MRLLFKQRLFSWFDSYDIWYDDGSVAYTVRGRLAWGHRLEIYSPDEHHLGTVREEIFSLLPRFALYEGDRYVGCIKKKFTLFFPRYVLDCQDWTVDGSLMGWDYTVRDGRGDVVMRASRQLLNWTDTYVLDIADGQNALYCLMVVLAIDAANCSHND